jgi:hypothetical protein
MQRLEIACMQTVQVHRHQTLQAHQVIAAATPPKLCSLLITNLTSLKKPFPINSSLSLNLA